MQMTPLDTNLGRSRRHFRSKLGGIQADLDRRPSNVEESSGDIETSADDASSHLRRTPNHTSSHLRRTPYQVTKKVKKVSVLDIWVIVAIG